MPPVAAALPAIGSFVVSNLPTIAAGVGTIAGMSTARGEAKAARQAQARAAQAQQAGTEAAIAEQRRQFDIATELTQPRREAEQAALMQLQNILGIGGGPAMDVSQIQIPGQEFAMGEAQRAIERSAAARGGLMSGATLAELQARSQGIAQQGYLQNYLQPLLGLAGGGAAQQQAQNALNLGFNVGGMQQQAGMARANILGQPISAAPGVGTALQGGLANLITAFASQ